MSKKKACKRCKIFFDGSECPNCKTASTTTNWKGRIVVLDSEKSDISKQMGLETKGEYAIKVN